MLNISHHLHTISQTSPKTRDKQTKEKKTYSTILIHNNRRPISHPIPMNLSVSQIRSKSSQHTPLYAVRNTLHRNSKRVKKRGRGGTHRNKSITHPTLSINIILAQDAITIIQALARPEPANSRDSRVIGVQDVDAAMGVFLGSLVRGVDLDCAVDSGGCDCWFVGMACHTLIDALLYK